MASRSLSANEVSEQGQPTGSMTVDDLILVSVDDHVVEPPDMFDGRLPARYADDAPRVVDVDGEDVWSFSGQTFQNIGLNAVVGREVKDFGVDPQRYDEMRPGCFDVDQRVSDMDLNGVLASVCFPTFPKFAGQWFLTASDRGLAEAVVRAYNDWHLEAWVGPHPDRFIPLGVLPLWDPELMAQEVRRLESLGCHAVTFPENPVPLGLESLHSTYWDPFWAACDELGTLVCMHFGSSSRPPITAPDAPYEVMTTLFPYSMGFAAADLVFSRALQEFSQLRFALSEGSLGWVPYLAERADVTYSRHREWTGLDLRGKMPSEMLRERVLKCFIEDKFGIANRDVIGVESIAWECDYPHGDTLWPHSPEAAIDHFADCSPAETAAMSHENAMRYFRFDPFTNSDKSECTVAALRARARARGELESTAAPDRRERDHVDGGWQESYRRTGRI